MPKDSLPEDQRKLKVSVTITREQKKKAAQIGRTVSEGVGIALNAYRKRGAK